MKHNTSFLLSPRKGATDIRCRISKGKDAITFIITQVDPDKWNKDTQRCRKNSYHGKHRNISAAVVNRKLSDIETAVDTFFNDFDNTFDADELREFLHKQTGFPRRVTSSSLITIANAYSRFILEEGKEHAWADSTYIKQISIKNDFIEMLEAKRLGKISISDTPNDIITIYSDYLVEKGNANQTIKLKISSVKWFFKWAIGSGIARIPEELLQHSPKLNTEDDDIVFLNEDEFSRIYNLELEDKTLRHVRDLFCFCCLTSLRFSDAVKLTKDNVHGNTLTLSTTKTKVALSIPLGKKAQDIIERYKGHDKLIPSYISYFTNRRLKVIAKMANIDAPVRQVVWNGTERKETFRPKYEVISFHASRRTFCSIAISNGISPHTVMKFTGHRTYASMKPYIDIADKSRQEAVAVFDKI